jgi:cation transport ATPase
MTLQMDTVNKFMMPGLVFLLTLASGFWLSKLGRPLNTIVFNIHKLIALGAVVAIAMQVFKLINSAQALLIIGIFVAALCVVALFATGALMSMDKPAYDTFHMIHQVSMALLIVGLVGIVYLLANKVS